MDKNWAEFKLLLGVNELLQATPPSAAEIVDMMFDPRGYWRTSNGYYLVSDDGEGSLDESVLWLQWFSPRGGRERYLLFEYEVDSLTSNLAYLDLRTGLTADIQSGRRRARAPSPGIVTLEVGSWILFFDGVNQVVRWSPGRGIVPVGFGDTGIVHPIGGDGTAGISVIDIAGVTDWATPTIAVPQQRGLGITTADARWEYAYGRTIINDVGNESELSPLSFATGATSTISGRRGTIVQVPEAPEHCRMQRIWRSKNLQDDQLGTPDVYLLTEIYHAGECDYVDIGPDQELRQLYASGERGPFPKGARGAALWQETMFVIDATASSVVFSYPRLLEQFPPLNRLPVATARSGPITSIHAMARAVVVFCERAVMALKGDSLNGFRVEQVLSGKGSTAPRAVVEIPGVGLAFLDVSGPQVLIGSLEDDQTTRAVPIGAEIRDTWDRRVNAAGLASARVTLDPVHREVWWQVPEIGSQRQTLGLIYHYGVPTEGRTWSTRRDWPIGDLDYNNGHVWFGGNNSANSGIYVVTPGAIDRAGTAFSSSYSTAWLVSDRRELLQHVRAQVIGTGQGDTIDVDHRGDRRVAWTSLADADRQQYPTEWSPAQWSVQTWSSTELWADYLPTFVPIHADAPAALEHQVRISSPRMWLLGIDFGLSRRGGPNPDMRPGRS